MEALIRRKLSMAVRARDFAAAHPVNDPSFDIVFKRLDATVTRADTIAMQQSDGRIGERAAVARRRALRDAIRRQYLRRLARIADLAAKDHPEVAGKFLLPSNELPNKVFLLAARSLLSAGTQEKEALLPLGIGETFFANFTRALDDFQAATEHAHTGRSNHVGARADLFAMASACIRDVDVLETFYREAFARDSDVMNAWVSARNVAGPFRRPAEPTDDETTSAEQAA